MASDSDSQVCRMERESAPIQHCEACQRKDVNVIAVGFCEDCPEYFCENCLQCHQKFRVTRKHATLTWGDDQPQIGPTGMSLGNELSEDKKHCKLDKVGKYPVSQDSDDKKCYITDIQILSNDGFLICDLENSKLKLLDKDLMIKASLTLDKKPSRTALLSDSSAVVTCPSEKEMIFITIGDDTLSKQDDRTIRFDKQCHDVVFVKGHLYVSCSCNPGNSEIRVLDLRGHLVKVVPGTDSFRYPYYIAYVANSIYVSDREVNKLSCITFAGQASVWHEEEMKHLHGFLLDEKLNVYICSSRTNKIKVVDADFQDSKFMFEGEEHDEYFTSMVYRGSDQRLIVGRYHADGIQTFKFV